MKLFFPLPALWMVNIEIVVLADGEEFIPHLALIFCDLSALTVHSTQVNQPHRFFLWCEAIVCNVVQLSLGHYMWAPPKSSDQTSSSQLVQLQNYKFHQNSEPDQLAVYKTCFAEDIIRIFSRKLQVWYIHMVYI